MLIFTHNLGNWLMTVMLDAVMLRSEKILASASALAWLFLASASVLASKHSGLGLANIVVMWVKIEYGELRQLVIAEAPSIQKYIQLSTWVA